MAYHKFGPHFLAGIEKLVRCNAARVSHHIRAIYVIALSSVAATIGLNAAAYNIPTSAGPTFDIGSVLSNYTSAGGGELYLKPLDNNLMGESYDVDTGSISFRQTDVSIPGNSSLPVQFSRRASGKSYIQYNGLVDTPLGLVWDIDLPYVVSRVSHDASANCSVVTPNNGLGGSIFSIGIKLYTPGGGDRDLGDTKQYSWSSGPDIRDTISANLSGFSGSDVRVTSDLWVSRCVNSANYPGVSGYEVRSPNGHTYFFDRARRHTSTFIGKEPGDNSTGISSRELDNIFMFPSKVSDLHGNWVKYEYNSHGPTRIHSNDGREITISYSGSKISRVSANGRHWDYTYNSADNALARVDLPDGETYWEYGSSGQGMLNNGMIEGGCLSKRFSQDQYSIHMRHPSGTRAEFETGVIISPITRVPSKPYTSPVGIGDGVSTACSWGSLSPKLMMTRAVLSKTLTLSDNSTREWNYDYHEPAGSWGRACSIRQNGYCVAQSKYFFTPDFYAYNYHTGGEEYRSKKRTVIDPTGATKVYTINVDWTRAANNEYAVGGIMKTETFETASSSTPLQTVTYPPYFGFSALGGHNNFHTTIVTANRRYLPTSIVTERDSDTFTKEFDYNIDPTSSNFAHMSPVETRSFSNVSTTPRVIEKTVHNDFNDWVLGLPRTHTINARLISTYGYNSKGQLTTQSSYGVTNSEVRYNTDGTIDEVEDAIGRTTKLSSWKRGRPQTIQIAFGTPDEITTSQIVDSNGWTTSQTDAKLQTTSFVYDNMGRTTQINPPGSYFLNTNVNYNFPAAGGAIQTITKGQSKETITYDSFYRPILTRSQALDTGWSSYVNTEYDALNRVIFSSQPSTDPSETKGVETTYDGLGRILEITENVAPFAKTRNEYHGSHRHRVYDAANEWTDYYSYGYDGPGNTDYRAIYKSSNGSAAQKTSITKNIYGQLTSLRQYGTHDGVSTDHTQTFFYDSKQRLCRHYVPEHGATKYQYDDAGQLIAYAKGQVNSGCIVPSNNSKVSVNYDELGRVESTSFQDINTPNISKLYDANGNVLEVNRGSGGSAVNWTYTYNELNLLTSEQLDIDNRNYDSSYVYNTSGFMTQKNQPNSRVINYTVDGLGRMKTVKNGSSTLASNTSFHANGSLHQMTYGNGHYFSHVLNDRLLTQSVLSYKGSIKAIDQTLSYDARGLITSITDGAINGNNRTYSYDGLGYLKAASGPWGSGSYKYDSLGNMREKILGSRSVNLTYDVTKNRVIQSADTGSSGTRTIAYDVRGNVTTLGNLAFAYDVSDQPIAVSGSANGIGSANGTYRYDGNLKRVKSIINDGGGSKTIYSIYDARGNLVHIDNVTDGKKTDYVFGPMGTLARITNNVVTYLHSDHLGSAQAGTHASGGVAWREQYTPFGEVIQNIASNDNLDGFTGHIRDDATGLNYMQARYHDPVIGRFLSVDPITFVDITNPNVFNRYSYTFNNPINMIDPDGRYGRGSGFTDKEWKRFDKAQRKAAEKIRKKAEKLRRKADKRDAKGKSGGDKKRAQAELLDGAADVLESDGSDGFMANGASGDEFYNRPGGRRLPDNAAAFVARTSTNGPGKTVTVNTEGEHFGSGSEFQRILGHESLHTSRVGLRDYELNGVKAYKLEKGTPERSLYDSIKGTPAALTNPDHIMDLVY